MITQYVVWRIHIILSYFALYYFFIILILSLLPLFIPQSSDEIVNYVGSILEGKNIEI